MLTSLVALTCACLCLGGAAASTVPHQEARNLLQVDNLDHVSTAEGAAVSAAMEATVSTVMKQGGKHFHSRHEVEEGLQKVDLQAVAKRLNGRLPADVMGLVQNSEEG